MRDLHVFMKKSRVLSSMLGCLLIMVIGGCAHTGSPGAATFKADNGPEGTKKAVLSVGPSENFGFLDGSGSGIFLQRDHAGQDGLPRIKTASPQFNNPLRDWNRIYAMATSSMNMPAPVTDGEQGLMGAAPCLSHQEFKDLLKRLRGPCAWRSGESQPASSAGGQHSLPNEPGGFLPSPLF
jgi:hypothetical protein